MLDDREGDAIAGGLGKGFHEDMVPLMVVGNLENILVLMARISRL